MHRPILLLFILATASCNNINPNSNTVPNTPTDTTAILADPKNNLNIQTAFFKEIDSSGIFLFPVAIGESNGEDPKSYKEMPEQNYWNRFFLNGATGELNLLGAGKMIIRSYELHAGMDTEDKAFAKAPGYILYNVTASDYNKDGVFTHEDPIYLFASDMQGRGFRQLSPAGYHVASWQYAPSVNKILMTVRKDSDGNRKFEKGDELATFDINLDSGAPAREVFGADFKNSLKLLYDRDWKRVKD